jgi:hypothetical protein
LRAIGEQRSGLGQSLKAIGEEVSEILADSTPSSADTGVVHVRKHSRNSREHRAESLKGIGSELSEQREELQTDVCIFIYIDDKSGLQQFQRETANQSKDNEG